MVVSTSYKPQRMKPEWPSANLRIVRIAAIAILLAVAGWSGYKLYHLPLWGWWPLPFLLSTWLIVPLVFFPADHQRRKWLALSTLSGVLLGLGFPPSPLTWVVVVALIPLLQVEKEIIITYGKANMRLIFGYSFHVFILWNIISTFWVTNTAFGAGLFANYVNALLMATVMTAFHLIRSKLPSGWYFIALASCWIGFEYFHHFWDLSWPWLTLGNAMAQYPWAIQWYSATGIFGGSLWILALNYTGYKAFIEKGFQLQLSRNWPFVVLLILPLSASLITWFTLREADGLHVQVTVVQPNFEPHYEKFAIPENEQLMRFLQLTMESIDHQTDYLVFPETSFDYIDLSNPFDNKGISLFQSVVDSFPGLRLITGISSHRRFNQIPAEKDIALRTYIGGRGDTIYWDAQNAAIQLTVDEKYPQVYFKSKLVPGPEIYPFKEVLGFLKPILEKLDATYEGHTTQKERSVFTGGKLRVAPVICYESIYGDFCGGYVRNGATAFFIVTNDGWWDKTPGHIQHLKLGALRAIEHRRPIARSANTGISAFIDIRGRLHQATEYGETTAIRSDIIPETRMTIYTKWGDVIAKICVAALAICIAMAIFTRLKNRKSSVVINS
jgi:apolipoprotein N-acyltransferase